MKIATAAHLHSWIIWKAPDRENPIKGTPISGYCVKVVIVEMVMAALGQHQTPRSQSLLRQPVQKSPLVTTIPTTTDFMKYWIRILLNIPAISRQLPDEFGTTGVTAEVPQFPLTNCHGTKLARCVRNVSKGYKSLQTVEQNVARRAHLRRNVTKCEEFVTILRKPRLSRPRLEAGDRLIQIPGPRFITKEVKIVFKTSRDHLLI